MREKTSAFRERSVHNLRRSVQFFLSAHRGGLGRLKNSEKMQTSLNLFPKSVKFKMTSLLFYKGFALFGNVLLIYMNITL